MPASEGEETEALGVGAGVGATIWSPEVVTGRAEVVDVGGKVKRGVVVGGRIVGGVRGTGGRMVRGMGVRVGAGVSCSLSRSRLCLVRRFWYHTFTCVSDRPSLAARSDLSRPTRYWLRRNSLSREANCSLLNVVLARFGRSRSRPFGKTSSLTCPLASLTVRVCT